MASCARWRSPSGDADNEGDGTNERQHRPGKAKRANRWRERKVRKRVAAVTATKQDSPSISGEVSSSYPRQSSRSIASLSFRSEPVRVEHCESTSRAALDRGADEVPATLVRTFLRRFQEKQRALTRHEPSLTSSSDRSKPIGVTHALAGLQFDPAQISCRLLPERLKDAGAGFICRFPRHAA